MNHIGTRFMVGLATLALSATIACAQSFIASLDGAQEVPPNSSTASGTVTATLTGSTLELNGSFAGLIGSFTASHIHAAPAGSNGGVVAALTVTGGGSAGSYLPASNTFVLSPSQVADLTAGHYYVNVHSSVFPGGELRGQLLREVTTDAVETAASFELGDAWPNPFNPTTTISFTTAETSSLSLQVYDLSGRRIATLADGMHARGNHQVTFDASGLGSGVYFYALEANGMTETRSMLLVK